MNKFFRAAAMLLSIAALSGALTGCARPIDADQTVMNINGTDITMAQYRYYYLSNKAQMDNGDVAYWTKNADKAAELKETTDNVVLQNAAYDVFLAQNDYAETDSDRAAVDAQIETIRSYYDSDEAYQQALTDAYLTEDLYRAMTLRYHMIYRYLYDTNLKNHPEEISNYIRVKHVLIKTSDRSDDEALELAQTVAEEARRGVDFDELVEKYGEDPGMENNTDGYYFTDDGSMVKEFQDASFALDEGDISDPVKTTHGYHVILRLPVEEQYMIDNFEQIFTDELFYKDFFDQLDAVEEALQVTHTKAYDRISIKTVQ